MSQKIGTDGRRLRPQGPYAHQGGVAPRHSTDEPFEPRRKIAGGEGGGKAAAQGEHPPASHAPDSVRDLRVPGVRGCAALSAALYPSEEPYALTSARTDLCGGCRVPGIPTATATRDIPSI